MCADDDAKSNVNEVSLFERFWLCVYSTKTENFGTCRCYDVSDEFPLIGTSKHSQSLSEVLAQIQSEFAKRNKMH
jgi:hypothetical protein